MSIDFWQFLRDKGSWYYKPSLIAMWSVMILGWFGVDDWVATLHPLGMTAWLILHGFTFALFMTWAIIGGIASVRLLKIRQRQAREERERMRREMDRGIDDERTRRLRHLFEREL